MKAKALSPIIASILLVVIAVILVSIILSFGQDFATKGLDQKKDVKELSKSDAEHFIYPKTFSDGVIQFSYSPPNNFGDINITKYKILYDNNETTEIELDAPHTLKAGTNTLPLKDFSSHNLSSKKFTLILETEDDKCVTLKNITNPYPCVELEELSSDKLIISFDISEYSETIDNDNNTVSLEVPFGTDITELTPTITVSENATINPLSGVAQNFTSPVTYTVTAEDSTTRIYTITVNVEEPELQQYFAGPLNPGTMANDATTGTKAWINTDNVKISDNNYSSALAGENIAGYPYGYTTNYLKATNFGFEIPTGATIDGIKVEVEAYASGPLSTSIVYIVKANGTIGSTGIYDHNNPSTDTNLIFGGDNQLWGESWTDENINDPDFGMVISIIGYEGRCLHENSLVSTDNGQIKIKDLQIGSNVVSYNDITKQLELKQVTNVWSNPISNANNRYFYIYYNNGEVIKATENHKFYINSNYIRADELKVGDNLLSSDFNEYPIENIEIVENTTDLVWDIEVEDNHNFFANDILVHNPPLPPPSGAIPFYAYVDNIRMTVYYTN